MLAGVRPFLWSTYAMPCDTRVSPVRQKTAMEALLAALETRNKRAQLSTGGIEGVDTGLVRVEIDLRTGLPKIVGLSEAVRDGMSDACLLRKVAYSQVFQDALAEAEARAGMKANVQAVAVGGWHSHDGGRSWGKD